MAEIMESTWLSSIRGDPTAKNKQAKREGLLDDVKAGKEILDNYQQLQALADELDEKVEDKLGCEEDRSMLSYKSLMITVQREMKDLKQKADEEETKSRREAKINSLEKELAWFMNEALRLDELCKKYKNELDKWKGTSEKLEDDRNFLENQIKNAKRQNKSLRSSVEKAQYTAYAALVNEDSAGASCPVVTGGPTLPRALPSSSMPAAEAPSRDGAGSPSGLSEELEQRYVSVVKSLKQQLEVEQRLAAKLNAVTDRQFGEPSELEGFFLQCIDRVREDVRQRKRNVAREREVLRGRKRAKNAGVPESEALLEINLSDFQVADRRRVVELLLSSDQVLTFLYDKLFPQSAA